MGKILYSKPNGKTGRYFPDIYVISERLLVEVKSTYTYDREKEINLLKAGAASLVCNFKFVIVDLKKLPLVVL